MKRYYYIFIFGGFGLRVPRKLYNWLTSNTRLTGFVNIKVNKECGDE